jgi:LPS O-antigen subunit length determinant protein (WzzB/FepE family)
VAFIGVERVNKEQEGKACERKEGTSEVYRMSAESNGVESREMPVIVKKADPHILDYFTTIVKHRKFVFFSAIIPAIALLAISFVMPQTFSSEATILPPERQSGVGGLMSFLAGSAALDLMKSQENPAVDLFKNVLDSRMIAEEVVADKRVRSYLDSFDTTKDLHFMMLHEAVTSEALRNGMMTVTVEFSTHWLPSSAQVDSVRRLTAYTANTLVRDLDRFNRERLITTAHNTRVFVERAYQQHEHELDSVTAAYQAFQEQHKTISLPEQLSSTVQAAAKLAAEAQQLEIQIGAEEHDLSPNSNRIRGLRAQLEEAQSALKKYDDGTEGEYAVALRSVPELSRQVAGYLREIKILGEVNAYLRQELEQQKIEEQKNLPTLQVLDSAAVPLKKTWPRKGPLILIGLIAGLAFSLLYVSGYAYFQRVSSNPEEHLHFIQFARAFRFGKHWTDIARSEKSNNRSTVITDKTTSRQS